MSLNGKLIKPKLRWIFGRISWCVHLRTWQSCVHLFLELRLRSFFFQSFGNLGFRSVWEIHQGTVVNILVPCVPIIQNSFCTLVAWLHCFHWQKQFQACSCFSGQLLVEVASEISHPISFLWTCPDDILTCEQRTCMGSCTRSWVWCTMRTSVQRYLRLVYPFIIGKILKGRPRHSEHDFRVWPVEVGQEIMWRKLVIAELIDYSVIQLL